MSEAGSAFALAVRGAHDRRTAYLLGAAGPVFATLHAAAGGAGSGTGILFCPPFGWDELCAHRSLRHWADRLAAGGHTALRIDLPATGDSAGNPRDGGMVDPWTATLASAAQWMRTSHECTRIVAIGIGIGGLLAVRAAATGAAIDDFVLWSAPSRGATLLREFRAFAQMARSETGDGEGPNRVAEEEDGALEVAGYVLSPATIADLEALDVTKGSLPGADRRCALLMGRDRLAPDRRLHEYMDRSGVQVTVADGVGYGRMMTHPQLAETPVETFATVERWLEDAPRVVDVAPAPEPSDRVEVTDADHADLRIGGVRVRETPFAFDYRGAQLAGVFATPDSRGPAVPGLCAVFLNAGAVRRIGPNRMWVETARRWAALGVPSLRLDLAGLGDSDGDEVRFQRTSEFYRDEIAEQALAALDELESRGLGSRFIIGGLCSGAYWAFHAALADRRIAGLFLLNLWAFFWSEELAASRDARRARAMLRRGNWLDILRIAVEQGRIGRMLRTRLRSVVRLRRRAGSGVGTGTRIDDALSLLRERNVPIRLLLSWDEPLAEDFDAEGRNDRLAEWPNLRYERIPIEDHTFRPVWAQRRVSAALDDALAQVLDSSHRAA